MFITYLYCLPTHVWRRIMHRFKLYKILRSGYFKEYSHEYVNTFCLDSSGHMITFVFLLHDLCFSVKTNSLLCCSLQPALILFLSWQTEIEVWQTSEICLLTWSVCVNLIYPFDQKSPVALMHTALVIECYVFKN